MPHSTEEKHTPGPWVTLDLGEIVQADDLDVVIATIDLYTDFGEANARLIAAAPTMFDYIAKMAASGDNEAAKIMEAIHGNA